MARNSEPSTSIMGEMMAKMKFDQEELEQLKSFEREEWQSVKDVDSQAQRCRSVAQATLSKDARVNIRI